jgi:superfamily II DNA or RNA helicase
VSTLHLRDYQVAALDALDEGWKEEQRLAVVLPTGAGKTVIMAHLAHERRAGRVLILVHRDELIQQTYDKLRRVDRTLSVGVVRGKQNEGGAAVVIASIQTVSRPNRLAMVGKFGTIIVDECHRSVSESYKRVLHELGAFVPWGPKVAGFTATMSRGDALGLGDVWERVAFSKGIKWFIDNGHLVSVTGKTVVTDLDLDGVKKTAGDYNERALGIAMTDDNIRTAIVDSYREHAADRQGVVFAPTVDSAEFFADGLNAAGFTTAGVYGQLAQGDRRARHERYRKGELQILTTCTALAEGWDAPWCSAAVLARPTLHQGLFIQQVGRVLRPWPGKTDAVVLDVAGATRRHNLHALIELDETREKGDSEFDELAEEIEEEERGSYKAYVQAHGFEDVDLFAGTEARWQRTERGVLFVSTAASIYFLAADGDSWRVGKTPVRGGAVEWLRTDCSADEALSWGGQLAIDEDPSLASIKARWRRSGPPSEKQRAFAQSLGVNTEGMNKSQVSDAIDRRKAGKILFRVPV